MGRMTWNGDAFLDAMESRYSARLDSAAQLLQQRMQARIATQGPPRSKPGESPHRDSGDLQASVTVQSSGMVRRIGSPLAYAVYLELGTSKMEARPWLVPTLIESGPEAAAVVAEGQLILT